MNILDLLKACKADLEKDINRADQHNLSFSHSHRQHAAEANEYKKQLVVSIDTVLAASSDSEAYSDINPYSCFGRQPHRMDFEQEEDYKARFNQWQDWETWKLLNQKSDE